MDTARSSRVTRRQLEVKLEARELELRRAQERLEALEALAFTDSLTGLVNRRGFQARLAQELARVQRRPDRALSLLVLDLDDFKQINDTKGHAAGDEVLGQVARFLAAHLRVPDVIARTGGDEFMVLLPDTRPTECGSVVARLRHALDQFSPVKCSLGSSSWAPGASAESLTLRADDAMYQDKRRRKTRGTLRLAV